ncbi:hypothetical protein Tco_1521440, partial [Tanacetum coccineum]
MESGFLKPTNNHDAQAVDPLDIASKVKDIEGKKKEEKVSRRVQQAPDDVACHHDSSSAAMAEVSFTVMKNTLYGYFVGKRLAYQVVENYVNNVWSKYGLKRIQLHVLKWDLVSLPLHWGKKPIQLDAYTSDMCLNSWGRSA